MDNVLDELWAWYRRKAFVPFAMVLRDGRRVEITRPLQFAFNERIVIVLDDDDRTTRFRPDEIVKFQSLHPVG